MEFNYSRSKHLQQNSPKWNNINDSLTEFDTTLSQRWNEAVKKGTFKYTLEGCKYKVLTRNSMQFVMQLNPQRAFNWRKNEIFENMNAAFSNKQFNFKKIKADEIILSLHPCSDTASSISDKDFSERNDHILAINISPIDNCHVLFIPELNRCLPQKITASSLLMAFDLLQLSGHPGFRIGFNSIHAWASINHLHYHAMYLDYPVYLDSYPASRHVKSHCYLLDDFALSAFLFNVPLATDERIEVAKDVCLIVDILHKKEIPYSVVITRGDLGARIVVFPRKSTKDVEKSPCFDVACVEVSGQFPIKTEAEYNSLDFDKAFNMLKQENLSEEVFSDLLRIVTQTL